MATATPTTRQSRLRGTMSQRLRAARTQAGLTQQEIADLIGIHLRSAVNYENRAYIGARKAIVVRAWADACGRSFEEIWGVAGRELPRSGCSRQTAGHTQHLPVLALTG